MPSRECCERDVAHDTGHLPARPVKQFADRLVASSCATQTEPSFPNEHAALLPVEPWRRFGCAHKPRDVGAPPRRETVRVRQAVDPPGDRLLGGICEPSVCLHVACIL